MSRHRNVRALNAEDEYEGFDEVYGHSYDDGCEFGVSPGTAKQFMYNRDKANVTFASVMGTKESIEEEPGEYESSETFSSRKREASGESSDSGGAIAGAGFARGFGSRLQSQTRTRKSSEEFVRPKLNQEDEIRLRSCVEEIQNVIGDAVPEWTIVDAVVTHDFAYETALDSLLQQSENKTDDAFATDTPQLHESDHSNNSTSVFPSMKDIPSSSSQTALPKSSLDPISTPKVVLASPKPQRVSKERRRRTEDVASGPVLTESDDVAATFGSPASLRRNPRADDEDGLESAGDGSQTPSNQLRSINRLRVEDAAASGSEDEREVSTPVSGGATPSSAVKSTGRRQRDRQKMLDAYALRKTSSKDVVNLVVVGHVDSGKSTLMGHLLYKTGNVSKKNMHKFEQESKKAGKASFAYAWVLDETEEERSRGVTIDVAQSRFETETQTIALLDAPGHRDFIPNMITGAAQADAAILVVNSTRGEFESGFDAGGQTREHALLVRSLGVGQIIVAVNKLDTVGWDQKRYEEIAKKVTNFLKQIGYKEADLSFVPCSGLLGYNLTKGSSVTELSMWYGDGPSLIERIDSLRPPERPVDKPFRLCVADVFKGMGSGVCGSGKIEAGAVSQGDRVLAMPAGDSATVKSVAVDDEMVQYGFAGDQVVLTLTGVNEGHLTVGSVLCDFEAPIKTATRFEARVVVFNVLLPLTQGCPLVFHLKSFNEPCVLGRLNAIVHKANGEVVKRRPKCLVKGSSAIVEIAFQRPVCLELYKDLKEMGRFMLRSGDNTVAAGMVTSVLA